MEQNTLIRAISRDGYVNMIAADTTGMCDEAMQLHKMAPTAGAALGRLLTAAAMMGSDLKGESNAITLRVRGRGPIGCLLASSDASCCARGYAENPLADPPRKANGKLDVGAAVGTDGTLEVIRADGFGEPYSGSVPLVSGELAEDITEYYFRSEQCPTVCALGVLTKNARVTSAGGYLIRLLPGTPDDVITELEHCAPLFCAPTELLSQGISPEEMISLLLPGFDMQILEESRRETAYRCRCSRERFSCGLISLGKKELLSLAEECENKPAEIKCEFCEKIYTFTSSELKGLVR